MVRAFCDTLEKAGYWIGLYTSRSVLSTHIEDDIKTRYALWVAEWSDKLRYDSAVGIWQYSEKGSVSGISGNVDLDICTTDFQTIIKSKGLNSFGQIPTPEPDNKVNVTVQIGNDNYKGTLEKA